jgi:hypothetical protein
MVAAAEAARESYRFASLQQASRCPEEPFKPLSPRRAGKKPAETPTKKTKEVPVDPVVAKDKYKKKKPPKGTGGARPFTSPNIPKRYTYSSLSWSRGDYPRTVYIPATIFENDAETTLELIRQIHTGEKNFAPNAFNGWGDDGLEDITSEEDWDAILEAEESGTFLPALRKMSLEERQFPSTYEFKRNLEQMVGEEDEEELLMIVQDIPLAFRTEDVVEVFQEWGKRGNTCLGLVKSD